MTDSNKPNARAYTVRKGSGGGKDFWTPVGSAWLHKDGKGFNVVLDALPVDGRLVIRAVSDKGEAAPGPVSARLWWGFVRGEGASSARRAKAYSRLLHSASFAACSALRCASWAT
jgi:hypothetical protein